MSMMLSSHELPNFWERVVHPEVVVVVAAVDTMVVAVAPMEEMVLMMPFSPECPNSSNPAAAVVVAVDPQDTLLLPHPMAPQAVVHPPEDTPVEVVVVAAVESKSDPPNLPNKLLLSTLEVDNNNNVAAEDTLLPLPHMALHPPVDPQEDTPVEVVVVVVAVAESALAAQREPNKSLSSTWEVVAVDPQADTAAVNPADIKPAVPFPQTLIHCSK